MCSVLDKFQNGAFSFKWRMSSEEEIHFGVEEKGMLHLFPDLLGLWPLVSLLTEGSA